MTIRTTPDPERKGATMQTGEPCSKGDHSFDTARQKAESLFARHAVPVSYYGPGVPRADVDDSARLDRIALEVCSGLRSIEQVEESIAWLARQLPDRRP